MIWRRNVSMFVWVVIRGWVLVWTAYCSAGRPKASQPIGCRTLKPAHPLVAANDIGRRISLRMADVQAGAAGIGKHVEDVELGPDGSRSTARKVLFRSHSACHFGSMRWG